MGDFCVTGFYSKLPIHRGTKAVAIICKVNKQHVSSMPCYLDGSELTPIVLPVIGYMGDYGAFDDYDESETTRLLEKVTGLPFYDICDLLLRTSKWHPTISSQIENYKEYKFDDIPEKIAKLEKLKALYEIEHFGSIENEPEFRLIYEHYDVYMAMAGTKPSEEDIKKRYDKVNETKEELDKLFTEYHLPCPKPLPKSSDCNMLTGKSICGYDTFAIFSEILRCDELNNEQKVEVRDKAMTILDEFNLSRVLPVLTAHDLDSLWYMGLYNFPGYDIMLMLDDIALWRTFVYSLDRFGGTFTYSREGGQNWHHDKQYCSARKKLLKVYKDIINKYNSKDEDE